MPSVSFFFIYLCVLYMLCIQHTVCISYSLYNMVITENCVWLTAFATRMIGSSAVLSSVEPRLRNRKCCGNPTINLEAEPSWQLPFFLYVYYVSPEFFFGGVSFPVDCAESKWIDKLYREGRHKALQHYLRSSVVPSVIVILTFGLVRRFLFFFFSKGWKITSFLTSQAFFRKKNKTQMQGQSL